MTSPPDKSPQRISEMFSALAPRYDLMNDLMTGFSHRLTRKFALKMTNFSTEQFALDLATGTGDFAILLHKEGGKSSHVIGCDFSSLMLMIAKQRIQQSDDIDSSMIELIESDISNLPFINEKFDVCTISYGIRNVQDPQQVISEINRVTKPHGRIIIVESAFPQVKIFRLLITIHFRFIVPLLARLFSSHTPAYSYYFPSVEHFSSTHSLLKILKKTGWKQVWVYPKLFGAVMIYVGLKSFLS